MIYTLMNKDAELFDIEMINGNIYKAENFREDNKKLLPVFLIDSADTESIIKWWRSRRIPGSRDGIKEVFFNLISQAESRSYCCQTTLLSDMI